MRKRKDGKKKYLLKQRIERPSENGRKSKILLESIRPMAAEERVLQERGSINNHNYHQDKELDHFYTWLFRNVTQL